MNNLIAKAEMAVRYCRWGDGIGGISDKDKDFFKIIEGNFFDRLRDITRQQVKDRVKMMRSVLKNKKK